MTPFKGTNRVTSPYGWRTSPINGQAQHHNGQDIVGSGAYPGAGWEVRELTGGTVLRVTSDQWRGKYVDVQTSPGIFERYQHMKDIYAKVGQKVPQGTVLGMAGTTGDSTGVHLHFEVQKNGYAINPEVFSDIPNRVGTYAGNYTIDGVQPAPEPEKPKMYTLAVGPMTAGDKNILESQAKALGLPVAAKEA